MYGYTSAKGKLKRTCPIYGSEFDALKKSVNPEVGTQELLLASFFVVQRTGCDLEYSLQEVRNIKITMCPPQWFYYLLRDNVYSERVYPSIGKFLIIAHIGLGFDLAILLSHVIWRI